MSYTVISDNFSSPKGTVLSEEELGTCNIAALLGVHLKVSGGGPEKVGSMPEPAKSVVATPEKDASTDGT